MQVQISLYRFWTLEILGLTQGNHDIMAVDLSNLGFNDLEVKTTLSFYVLQQIWDAKESETTNHSNIASHKSSTTHNIWNDHTTTSAGQRMEKMGWWQSFFTILEGTLKHTWMNTLGHQIMVTMPNVNQLSSSLKQRHVYKIKAGLLDKVMKKTGKWMRQKMLTNLSAKMQCDVDLYTGHYLKNRTEMVDSKSLPRVPQQSPCIHAEHIPGWESPLGKLKFGGENQVAQVWEGKKNRWAMMLNKNSK